MVFKRKKKQTTLKNLKSLFFPEGGWRRAIEYLSHRIKRLQDSPHRIALGLSFGVFASFSPLFGFHFVLGALLAYVFKANMFASNIVLCVPRFSPMIESGENLKQDTFYY